ELGADLRFAARVLAVDREDGVFRVRFASDGEEHEARARGVVGAWGRWDPLDRRLDRGFTAHGKRYLGWSRDSEPEPALAESVRLYAFPGGYCGLSRVEGGAVHLAGVVEETARRRLSVAVAAGWDAVVAHARATNPDLDRDLSALRPGQVGF